MLNWSLVQFKSGQIKSVKLARFFATPTICFNPVLWLNNKILKAYKNVI